MSLRALRAPSLSQARRLATTSSNSTSSASASASPATAASKPKPPPLASSASPIRPIRRKLSSETKLLIAAGTASVGGIIVYRQYFTGPADSLSSPSGSSGSNGHRQATFTVPSPSGSSKTLEMLSPEQTDARLRQYEASYVVNRTGNPVWRYDTAVVPSNQPVEDDSMALIQERSSAASSSGSAAAGTSGSGGDLTLFGVFDGHAGWQTSKLLSRELAGAVLRELQALQDGATIEYFDQENDANAAYHRGNASLFRKSSSRGGNGSRQGATRRLWDFVRGGGSSTAPMDESDGLLQPDEDPHAVEFAIRAAFRRLDNEIVQGPVRLLESGGGSSSSPLKLFSSGLDPETGLSAQQMKALQTLLPAMSGSCALLTLVDSLHNRVHVACTGDSRAVMGTYENGKWRADVLSEDQTGSNEREAERMRSEHPADERETVVMRGRVLGGLEPTRAFGDARYKWAKGLGDRLQSAFLPGRARPEPREYKTPPYVTAEPLVQTRTLPQPAGEGRRFIVMATDGLWDRLRSDEVVGLVGAWLDNSDQPLGPRRTLSRKQVLSNVVAAEESVAPPDAPIKGGASPKQFVFEDSNLATHLIRNSLGGADSTHVSTLLSIPAPLSRRYRDDVTAVVLLLGNSNQASTTLEATSGVARLDTPRAKL